MSGRHESPRPATAPARPTPLGIAVADQHATFIAVRERERPHDLAHYVSGVWMFPDLDLGIAMLTHQESGEGLDAIFYRIADHFLQAPAHDWLTAIQTVQRREADTAGADDRKTEGARNTASRPSLQLARYAGKYAADWYGEIVIEEHNDELRIRFTKTPVLQGKLEHCWQYDTFVARWDDRELRADAFVTFALNPDGSIDQAKMRAVSSSTDFSFDFHDLLLKPVR